MNNRDYGDEQPELWGPSPLREIAEAFLIDRMLTKIAAEYGVPVEYLMGSYEVRTVRLDGGTICIDALVQLPPPMINVTFTLGEELLFGHDLG